MMNNIGMWGMRRIEINRLSLSPSFCIVCVLLWCVTLFLLFLYTSFFLSSFFARLGMLESVYEEVYILLLAAVFPTSSRRRRQTADHVLDEEDCIRSFRTRGYRKKERSERQFELFPFFAPQFLESRPPPQRRKCTRGWRMERREEPSRRKKERKKERKSKPANERERKKPAASAYTHNTLKHIEAEAEAEAASSATPSSLSAPLGPASRSVLCRPFSICQDRRQEYVYVKAPAPLHFPAAEAEREVHVVVEQAEIDEEEAEEEGRRPAVFAKQAAFGGFQKAATRRQRRSGRSRRRSRRKRTFDGSIICCRRRGSRRRSRSCCRLWRRENEKGERRLARSTFPND